MTNCIKDQIEKIWCTIICTRDGIYNQLYDARDRSQSQNCIN
jgi:hypothetical protein